MTGTLALEKWLRRRSPGPVDYDTTGHVVTAASAVLRHRPATRAGRSALFLVVHWGYGSAVGAAYPALRTRLGNQAAAGGLFYLGCQAMAMTLFPTLGGTSPPWRWRRSILLSSLAQHAVYAATVCVTEEALAGSRR
jgi:hypothetical protein